MGFFDSLFVACECGNRLEFQSKGGECCGIGYGLFNVPDDVLFDVNRNAPVHCPCGNWCEIDIVNRVVITVAPPPAEGGLSIRLSDGKVLDYRRMVSEGGGQFVHYYGAAPCGQFDVQYIVQYIRDLKMERGW